MRKVAEISGWLVLTLVTLVLGVVSAFDVRAALEREREFRAAQACDSVPVRVSACVWDQEFTVRRADAQGGKGRSPRAELSLPDGKPWVVTFPKADPVVSEMEPGERIVGVIWNGQVVQVRDAEGRSQQATSGPVGWAADRLGGALAAVSFGLTGVVGSVWGLIARRDRRHARASAIVRWHGVALGVAALLTLWAQPDGWPLWAIPAIWGPLALVLLATMTVSAVAALRTVEEGPDATAPTVPAQAAADQAVHDARDLPREYRMSRGRRNTALVLATGKAALLLFLAWTEELIPSWVAIGLTVALPPLLAVLAVRAPRAGTLVDRTGIRIRGSFRTRTLAWQDILDIRATPVRGADVSSFLPAAMAHAYLANGRRKQLAHLNSADYDMDREIAILRAALAELRGTHSAPNAPVS